MRSLRYSLRHRAGATALVLVCFVAVLVPVADRLGAELRLVLGLALVASGIVLSHLWGRRSTTVRP